MIVVTIGTNEQPFDRLIRAARALDSDELLVQYGSSREAHGRGEWVEFLSFDELAERARSARARPHRMAQLSEPPASPRV